jgi:hypothetical protein
MRISEAHNTVLWHIVFRPFVDKREKEAAREGMPLDPNIFDAYFLAGDRGWE